MTRRRPWTEIQKSHGVQQVNLRSWEYFADFIHQEMLDFRDYVWRGQRNSNWQLEPTLDRELKGRSKRKRERVTQEHLAKFKYAIRGRRGSNPPEIENENECWALGQDNGLKTPLLDWTTSPFVAAYFAFFDQGPKQTRRRAVFALSQSTVKEKSDKISGQAANGSRPPIIEFIRPMSNENPRLVNQGGLFTRAPMGVNIEEWIRSNFAKNEKYLHLLKITIPDRDRTLCLRSLNRMNINHLTLFPDLFGASMFCNTDLAIDNY